MTSKPGVCPGCDRPVLIGKHGVMFNVSPKDGLLHRQSCTNPPPVKTETVEQVRRQYRL